MYFVTILVLLAILLPNQYMCLNWADQNKVLPVRNEDNCVRSGTIDVLDAISSFQAISTKSPPNQFSAQQVFDCNKNWCICDDHPNSTEIAFSIADNQFRRIDLESDHPYTGVCKANQCNRTDKAYKIGLIATVPVGHSDQNYEHIFDEMLRMAPIQVDVSSNIPDFRDYKGGIYSTLKCSQQPIDHSLLLVGFGEENGIKYWIARNSYGTQWGEQGYIRLRRGIKVCNIGSGYIRIDSVYRKQIYDFEIII